MQTMNADQVKEAIAAKDQAVLINVLPEERYREKHIPGSVNVPLGDASFLQRVESIRGDKATDVIVYCADADCNASPKAAEKLEQAGFERVHDFEGGVAEWEAAGYPLEGEAKA